MTSDKSAAEYDYVVVGAGVGGLFTAALLASEGHSVCLLEKHYALGGYGHSFHLPGESGEYCFNAHLHYIFNCMKGEDGEKFFRKIGLQDEVSFTPLNPEGFDHLRFPSVSYDIAKGSDVNIERLAIQFPEHEEGLQKYFSILQKLKDELYEMPIKVTYGALLRHPIRYKTILRYHRWTLQDLLDHLHFPTNLQAILAGQMFDLALPPNKVSLACYAGNAMSYDAGACVPTRGFEHLFLSVADTIIKREGCAIKPLTTVTSFETSGSSVSAAHTAKGERIVGKRFLFNGDPKLLRHLVGEEKLSTQFQKKLSYDYSTSTLVVYLGVKGIDLREHGFGDWNVWHYPTEDINGWFDRQVIHQDMSDPALFISTPSLHGWDHLAPEGCQEMVYLTWCPYDYFNKLMPKEYERRKKQMADNMLSIIEQHYVPGIKEHVDFMEIGTPLTNERFVNSPLGNVYGMSLSPENIRPGKISYTTPFQNLFLVGAVAGIPSFGGGLHCAMKLFEKLTGKAVR